MSKHVAAWILYKVLFDNYFFITYFMVHHSRLHNFKIIISLHPPPHPPKRTKWYMSFSCRCLWRSLPFGMWPRVVCYLCTEDSEWPPGSSFQNRPSTVTVGGTGSSETSVHLFLLYFVTSQNSRPTILKTQVKTVAVFNSFVCFAQGSVICVFRNDSFRPIECFWCLCWWKNMVGDRLLADSRADNRLFFFKSSK
jgi:hypothetical protein